jgi:hypothetical protein
VWQLTLTVLSQPDETSRLTTLSAGCAETKAPAAIAGAQETAVQPMECAESICNNMLLK